MFVCGFLANRSYLCENIGELIQYLLITKSQYPKSALAQRGIALLIGFPAGIMNFAIDFDDQPKGMTVKVHDEVIYDLLPTKMPAIQPVRPDFPPQDAFGLRHVMPQLPGELYLLMGNSLTPCNEPRSHLVLPDTPSLQGKG